MVVVYIKLNFNNKDMVGATLKNYETLKREEKQIAEIVCQILNILRNVILLSNEKEFDELLLCGLFAFKVLFFFCNFHFYKKVFLQTIQLNAWKWELWKSGEADTKAHQYQSEPK